MSDGDEGQERLDEWLEDNLRQPILHKDEQVGPIYVPSKGNIWPGYRGWIPARDEYGFVQFCDREPHYHRKMEGYALSDKVLVNIRSRGCKRILMAEEDTGDVYEFHESQFCNPMPKHAKGKDEKDEAQSYAKCEEAWGRFAGHAEYVLVGDREIN